MTETYKIKSSTRFKKSATTLRVEASTEQIVFTEQMQMPEEPTLHKGRSVVVDDVSAFENLIGYGPEDLDEYMEKLQESELLDIDYLHRLCERKRVPYTLCGDSLAAVYTRFLKKERSEADSKLARGRAAFAQALVATLSQHPERNFIVEQFTTAINLGIKQAYAQLAFFYHSIGEKDNCLETLERGIKSGDADALVAKANILIDPVYREMLDVIPTNSDYRKAVNTLLKAAEKGALTDAAHAIGSLIGSGNYVPKADNYVKIIALSARARRVEKEQELAAVPADSDLRHAHRLLNESPVNPEAAYQILHRAFNEGRMEACVDLFKACKDLKRIAEAARVAVKGAEAGLTDCYYLIGQLYHWGVEVNNPSDEPGKPDYQKAIKWFAKAIEAGDMRAVGRFESYYRRGIKSAIPLTLNS